MVSRKPSKATRVGRADKLTWHSHSHLHHLPKGRYVAEVAHTCDLYVRILRERKKAHRRVALRLLIFEKQFTF